MTPAEFINRAEYNDDNQKIWAVDKKGEVKLVLELMPSIGGLFKTVEEVSAFQDELGQYIVDAINEKIEREKQ